MDAPAPRPPGAPRSTKPAPRRVPGGGSEATTPTATENISEESRDGRSTPASGPDFLVEIHPEDLQLEVKVGSGLTAEVYRGRYNGDQVAIKQLFRHRKMDLKEKVSFVREVAVLAKVAHVNLVKMFGVAFKEQPFRIVTEFCEGGTVFDAVHNGFVLDWHQRRKMCTDVAKGMDYLHSFTPQIIHRDLKSLNLLLDKALKSTADVPCVKVSDFGLSRMKDDDNTAQAVGTRVEVVKQAFVTKEGTKVHPKQKGTIEALSGDSIAIKFDVIPEVQHVMNWDRDKIERLGLWGKMTSQVGTPHWMAPEVHKGSDYDESCDVYSYAMVIYEIVCRRVPFEEEEAKHIGNITTKGGRPNLENVPPDSPAEITRLMVQCWAHDPVRRPKFEEICRTLDAAEAAGRQPTARKPTLPQGPFNVVSL